MLAPPTDPVWTNLVKGTIDHQFRLAAASMFFFNLRNQFARTPSRLPVLIQEAHKFFRRYESILAEDIRQLFG